MNQNNRKHCMCTVTSPDFVPGTRVLVRSFLKNNPWFTGDIVIITDEPGTISETNLNRIPGVAFQLPGDDLRRRVDTLCEEIPALFPKRKRFYSLEAFRLEKYDKLLFFDSDMLVVRDLAETLSYADPLLACSDQPGRFFGRVRDKRTFKRMSPGPEHNSDGLLLKTFNAGFMVLGKQILNNATYQGLLELIHPEVFREVRTHNTDQVVLNRYFDMQASFLPFGYNTIVSKWSEMKAINGMRRSEIKVLHFTGNYKPWEAVAERNTPDEDPDLAGFFKMWHAYDAEILAEDGPTHD